jgi:hypothetical protein
MKLKLQERRRYVRIEVPLKIKVKNGNIEERIVSKNISPVGVRFEISQKLDEAKPVNMAVSIPISREPVRIKGKIAWQAKTSLEDNAPYDAGVEITEIADKDKNTFLKYICDTLYGSSEYSPRE